MAIDPEDKTDPRYPEYLLPELELEQVPLEKKRESVPPPFVPLKPDAFRPGRKHRLS